MVMDAFKVAVQKDGSYYAMPWHTDTNAILYNKRFFEQAGIEGQRKLKMHGAGMNF